MNPLIAQSEEFVWGFDYLAIPVVEIVDSDTVYIDTLYSTCTYSTGCFKKDSVFFDIQSEYLRCLGYSSLQEYAKSLPHNSTILVLEPSGTGIYRVNTCKINGIETCFLLDTGAATVSISEDLCKKAIDSSDYLDEVRLFKIADGRVIPKQVVNIKDFEIGGIHVDNVEATVGCQGSSFLLGQSVLKLLPYKIEADRLVIYKDNPNYNLYSVVQLVCDISTFFHSSFCQIGKYRISAHGYAEHNKSCEHIIEKILELERICDLDALHLVYLATCYYEIGDYGKCIQMCNRYLYSYSSNTEKVYQRMKASVYSLISKSMYYDTNYELKDVLKTLCKVENYRAYCDPEYYQTIEYLVAICSYCLGDYATAENKLKQSVIGCRFSLSDVFGYRIEDWDLLSKMLLDFSLWSYEVGENKHSDTFLRNSCCMKNQCAEEIMQRHPILYENNFFSGPCHKVFDLYLSIEEGFEPNPLLGNDYCLIKTRGVEDVQNYYYNKMSKILIFGK